MPYGMYLSAAGANVQNHRLEVLSHNLANVETPGFKPHMAILQARHAEAIDRGEASSGSRKIDDLGGGAQILPSQTEFTQGAIESTGRRTDFAINDNSSFFVVQRGDDKLLTRAGDFLFDSQGRLSTTNGDPVLTTQGNPLQINPSLPFNVRDDGVIQQGGEAFPLMLAKPNSLGDLSRVGDNLYRPLAEVTPIDISQRSVISGSLEKSSVKPTSAMMELIEASRTYEANLRLIQHQDQTMGSLIGRILKE